MTKMARTPRGGASAPNLQVKLPCLLALEDLADCYTFGPAVSSARQRVRVRLSINCIATAKDVGIGVNLVRIERVDEILDRGCKRFQPPAARAIPEKFPDSG